MKLHHLFIALCLFMAQTSFAQSQSSTDIDQKSGDELVETYFTLMTEIIDIYDDLMNGNNEALERMNEISVTMGNIASVPSFTEAFMGNEENMKKNEELMAILSKKTTAPANNQPAMNPDEDMSSESLMPSSGRL